MIVYRKFALLLALSVAVYANFNHPLHRSYTLRNSVPFILEAEYHRMIVGKEKRSFIFPRPCLSPMDSSMVCDEETNWKYADKERQSLLNLIPQGGMEYRYTKEHVEAFDGGLNINGYSMVAFIQFGEF